MAVAQDSGVGLCYWRIAICAACRSRRRSPLLGKRVGLLAHDIYASHFYRQMGRLSFWSWLWSWIRPDVHFAWDDMGPSAGISG